MIRPLAEGGMAEILVARDTLASKSSPTVVIKRILPHLRNDENIIAMFLEEARVASSLEHANIVRVLDSGSSDGGHFLVMEHLEGSDVAALMERGAISIRQGIRITMGVLAALEHAHDHEVVHRDVSPQNVFVTGDDRIKLLDFGVAGAESARGKTPYMSPEQATGEGIDARSDLFSTSVLLWELTTGRRLFKFDSEIETLRAIVERDAPSPHSVIADYPKQLAIILRKGLMRNPDERFQSAKAMHHELERFLRSYREPEAAHEWSWGHIAVLAFALLGLGAIAIAAAWKLTE